ncbi:hypothetical protein M6B38_228700 [Iris pallida]|uniref:F5/8 type C domain-containing protein n=1 Tax=Iris pallida TaxID=29817 RepID=A0AAX6DT81_IRIPA|nr:hypothetical protein M6B38_228700 [Iris pallida]
MKREQEELRTNSSPKWRRTATTRQKWWPGAAELDPVEVDCSGGDARIKERVRSAALHRDGVAAVQYWQLSADDAQIWKKVEKVEQRSTRRKISGRASTVERRRG